ncbi:MAG: ABC transporter permease subunit [Kofleriaceae bacterium]
MSAAARVAARVIAAWLLTWLCGWILVELAAEPPARLAARAAGRLPPDDAPVAARDEVIAAQARGFGLDGGPAARTARVVGRALALAPGPGWRDGRPAGVIARHLAGATLARVAAALAVAIAAGALAALALARRRRGGAALAVGAALAIAMPTVWLCQLLLTASPGAALSSTAAVAILAVAPAAVVALHVGTALAALDASPLAIAVAARGASRRRWHAVHGLALIAPGLAPLFGSTVGFTLAASPVVERALALPGAGRTLVAAAAVGDVPVVLTLAAGAAALVALVAGLADLVARRLDPRIAEAA